MEFKSRFFIKEISAEQVGENSGKMGGGEGLLVIPEITPLERYFFLALVTENHLDPKQNKTKSPTNNSRKTVYLPKVSREF